MITKKITHLCIALTAMMSTLCVHMNAQTASNQANPLILNLTISYNTKVVQVSVDAADGENGSFQITNAEGVVVQQMDVVELVKSPYYFTINVSDFKEGDYTFQIKGKTKTYTSTLHIK